MPAKRKRRIPAKAKLAAVKTISIKPKTLFIVGVLTFVLVASWVRSDINNHQQPDTASDYNSFLNVVVQTDDSKAKPKPTPTPTAPSQPALTFGNPSGQQLDSVMVVGATLSDRATGSCRFRIEQGNAVIQTTTHTYNSPECESRIALSRFPQSGLWLVSITFTSNDGQQSATQAPFNVYVAKY